MDTTTIGAPGSDTAPTAPTAPTPPVDPPMPAVQVRGLTKRYGRRVVVNALDVTLSTGSVTGLIGPNGAGKTTVMAMLLGLVRPSAGTGTVLGRPLGEPTAYLPRVGALIEAPAFHPGLSGRDNLVQLCLLGGHDRRRIAELVHLVGLTGREGDPVGAYSLGMKQRLGIAAALLADPELVILDEPSNGVDPVGMRDLRRIIQRVAAEGRTVLVSSHLLAELEQVCDELLVIDRGGLVYQGTRDALPRSAHEAVELTPADPAQRPALCALLRGLGHATTAGRTGLLVRTDGRRPHELGGELNALCQRAGILLGEVAHRNADLESRYLELVGEADPTAHVTADVATSANDHTPTSGTTTRQGDQS